MTKLGMGLLVYALLAGATVFRMAFEPSLGWAMLVGLSVCMLGCALPLAAWHAYRCWSTGRFQALLPLIVVVAIVPAAGKLGWVARELDFRYRRRPCYEEAIRAVERDDPRRDRHKVHLPE